LQIIPGPQGMVGEQGRPSGFGMLVLQAAASRAVRATAVNRVIVAARIGC
jgi:hypothetical protein